MALEDLVKDLATAITFIISGFLSVNVALHLSQRRVRQTDIFDITLWSISVSVVIYGVDLFLDFALARSGIIAPGQLGTYFPFISLILAVPFGVIGAMILLWDWADGIRNWLHKRAGERAHVGPSRSVWDATFSATKSAWLFVHTDDNKEYYGGLAASSSEGDPRELVIRDPRLISRRADGSIEKKILLGEKLLIREPDIRRVVFFKVEE